LFSGYDKWLPHLFSGYDKWLPNLFSGCDTWGSFLFAGWVSVYDSYQSHRNQQKHSL
jgi:hypothetical protein